MVHISEGNGGIVKNSDLYKYLLQYPPMKPMTVKSKKMLFSHILEVLSITNLEQQSKNNLQNEIHVFSTGLARYWLSIGRDASKFEKKYAKWLAKCIITSGANSNQPSTSGSVHAGRPKKQFQNLCTRNKRRLLQSEVYSRNEDELYLATEMKLRSLGKYKAAKTIKDILSSPSDSSAPNTPAKDKSLSYSYTSKEALALCTELKLTRRQYIELRASAVQKGLKHLYPPYYKILEEKVKCYPQNISITDVSAQVPLQDLLDHTIWRILECQGDVLNSIEVQDASKLTLVYKWGADGSGGHSNYKQKFHTENSDDSNIFISCIVPLKLIFKQGTKENVLWQNQRPNSTRFCRPIRLQFLKETSDSIAAEFEYIENQISNLKDTEVIMCSKTYTVHHVLLKTMIDGKVANALTSTRSTQKCYICKASSSEFNKLVNQEPRCYDTATLDFGISPLHATLRSFECLLHIAYKLPLKSWQARGENNKKIVNDRKRKIQQEFRSELGLLIDMPKQNFGNTNDGNTARAFFSNSEVSSRITGIDHELIVRFRVILTALNSQYKINSTLFGTYAKETAMRYVDLYGWYPMPPTIHKILAHGKDVIDHFLIPIGQLGEDAQESRHKDVRYYREHNTRKMSRKETNEDLFKILLLTSDPIISQLRRLPLKKGGTISKEVLHLLAEPDLIADDEN